MSDPRKLQRRRLLQEQIEQARVTGIFEPHGVIDYQQAMSLLHHNVLDSAAAEDLYWAFFEETVKLDGRIIPVWKWTSEAWPYRPAIMQLLRTIAEAGIDANHAARVQVYNKCPECGRHDYITYPSGMQECRCGEYWRPESVRMRRERYQREQEYARA